MDDNLLNKIAESLLKLGEKAEEDYYNNETINLDEYVVKSEND